VSQRTGATDYSTAVAAQFQSSSIRTSRNVANSYATLEALPLEESMHVWVLSSTLKHDVKASLRPGFERGLYE